MTITAFLNTSEGDVTFDAVMSETTNDSNTITRHPVEFGADISDHNYANPRKFVMNYLVTNTPFVETEIAPGATNSLTRARSAWEVLLRIRNTGDSFSLQSELEIVHNIAIAGLSVTQDKDTTEMLGFTANLEELIVVETELVEFPADQLNPAVQKQAQSNVQGGLKQKSEVTDESLLLQLANIFGFSN